MYCKCRIAAATHKMLQAPVTADSARKHAFVGSGNHMKV